MRQLDAQERRRIRRHRPRQRRPKAREEGLEATTPIHLPHHAPNADVPLGRLQPTLDRVHREHGDPHGHARRRARRRDRQQAQLPAGLPRRGVYGRQPPLHVLVRGKVGRAAGPVARERGGRPAEDGPHAALAVQLAYDIQAAAVARLLARRELLVLHLKDDLDAFKGCRYGRHGDGGEEAGGGDLADGERAGGRGGGECGDEGLAEVIAPEGDGDCVVQ